MKRPLAILALFFLSTFYMFSLSMADLPDEVEISDDIPEKVRVKIIKLYSDDRIERRNAALELWEMGEDASYAVPYLIDMLDDEDWYVRKDAIFALGILCDDRAEACLKKLRDEDPVPAIRKAATIALKSLKGKNKAACDR